MGWIKGKKRGPKKGSKRNKRLIGSKGCLETISPASDDLDAAEAKLERYKYERVSGWKIFYPLEKLNGKVFRFHVKGSQAFVATWSDNESFFEQIAYKV